SGHSALTPPRDVASTALMRAGAPTPAVPARGTWGSPPRTAATAAVARPPAETSTPGAAQASTEVHAAPARRGSRTTRRRRSPRPAEARRDAPRSTLPAADCRARPGERQVRFL